MTARRIVPEIVAADGRAPTPNPPARRDVRSPSGIPDIDHGAERAEAPGGRIVHDPHARIAIVMNEV